MTNQGFPYCRPQFISLQDDNKIKARWSFAQHVFKAFTHRDEKVDDIHWAVVGKRLFSRLWRGSDCLGGIWIWFEDEPSGMKLIVTRGWRSHNRTWRFDYYEVV